MRRATLEWIGDVAVQTGPQSHFEGRSKIIKKLDDAHVARLSGEQPGGYYCIYRGNKEAAIEGLRAALKAMELMAKSLDATTASQGARARKAAGIRCLRRVPRFQFQARTSVILSRGVGEVERCL
jgi:hypothetical protein